MADRDGCVKALEEGHLEQHVHVLGGAVVVKLLVHGQVGHQAENRHVGPDHDRRDPERCNGAARVRGAHKVGGGDGGCGNAGH